MKQSKIEWTNYTFNPWLGCTRVSSGCKNCYAEEFATRFKLVEWGEYAKRKRTSDKYWKYPLVWNKRAKNFNERYKIFCASLADVFDERADINVRKELFEIIRNTEYLEWQLLTKRPQNVFKYLPDDWGNGYQNVWLGVSAEDQETYDERWPILLSIPAKIRFISYEPALKSLTVKNFSEKPDWLIWGGESGRKARKMNWKWAYNITLECKQYHIPVFGKQWGTYQNNPQFDKYSLKDLEKIDPLSNGKGGALLPMDKKMSAFKLFREFPSY